MIKDADTVKRMFYNGTISALDADARYTYSSFATCFRCGAGAFVTRYERSALTPDSAVFRCSSCFNQFGPGIDNISFM
jgi:hypothetical protein